MNRYFPEIRSALTRAMQEEDERPAFGPGVAILAGPKEEISSGNVTRHVALKGLGCLIGVWHKRLRDYMNFIFGKS